MQEDKRSFMQKLIAQWPGVLGLLSIGLGLLIIWQVHQNGQNANNRSGLIFIVIGIVGLGYWSFANRNDNYNF